MTHKSKRLMDVKYLEEGNVYLISNHVVARNQLFRQRFYCKRFLVQFKRYIGTLCELISYTLEGEEFVMLIRLRDRNSFEEYYRKKMEFLGKDIGEVPASTYIFSQAMANLQSSMAIHFNRREGRTGALFARRFRKRLVLTKEELKRWINRLESGYRSHRYQRKWRSREENDYWGSCWFSNSKSLVGRGKGMEEGKIWRDLLNRLQGHMKKTQFYLKYGLHLPFMTPIKPRPT